MNLASLRLIAPVLSLSAFAFILFALDAISAGGTRKTRVAGFWITLIGLVVSGALLPLPSAAPVVFGRDMLVWDGLAYFLSWVAVLTIFFVVLIGEHYAEYADVPMSAYYGLLLLAGAGLALISSSNDFLMIFLSIELIGIPGFILSGYLRNRERSNEAAIKFFLIGAFSSAMLAYGVSLLYGITGSTSLSVLRTGAALLDAKSRLALLAFFFVIVSFGFKIALVPFHMWVPDVFEGAPTPIAAFLSVGPKIAGVAITLRVFQMTIGSTSLGLLTVLAALAAITMTVANLIGLQQTNVVRLLAYSSIAHMGYMLLGLIAGGPLGITSVYLYGWAYLFMNLGAFGIVIALSNALGSTDISSYAGLSRRAPGLSALMVLFLMGLAGLPPTAGFLAKFYVFSAAFQAHWVWLVLLASFNTVISVTYYFKIFHAMYFKPATEEKPIELTGSARFALFVTALSTLLIGVGPQLYIRPAEALVVSQPGSTETAPVVSVGTASSSESAPATNPVPAAMPEPSQQ